MHAWWGVDLCKHLLEVSYIQKYSCSIWDGICNTIILLELIHDMRMISRDISQKDKRVIAHYVTIT